MTDAFENFKKKMENVDGALETLAPQKVQLAEISDLINKKLQLESQAAQITENLNTINSQLDDLNTKAIPDKMMELGLSKITTDSGAEVTITKIYRGNISANNADAALKWFIETDQADSIKNAYTVTLGVGKSEESSKLEQVLDSSGFSFKNKKDIAWNTLASILKELDTQSELENNEAWEKLQEENKVPITLSLKEALGMYTKNETKLKFKKK